ncbi:hypothetical protein ACLMJK_004567 [Lecanora helva]
MFGFSRHHDRRALQGRESRRSSRHDVLDWPDLFEQALKPFTAETGTAYSTTQADIDFHSRHFFRTQNLVRLVSDEHITADMLKQNDPKRRVSDKEYEACKRLVKMVKRYKAGFPYGPDLAIKAFNDLDTVFFGGSLRGNVYVKWGSCHLPNNGFGCTSRGKLWHKCSYAYTQSTFRQRSGQTRIYMNADLIFAYGTKDPFKIMMSTLLHEMCHAIDDVRCGRSHVEDGDGAGHHDHFGTWINVVHQLARRLGLEALAENEPYVQHHWLKLPSGQEGFMGCGGGDKQDNHGHDAAGRRREATGPTAAGKDDLRKDRKYGGRQNSGRR